MIPHVELLEPIEVSLEGKRVAEEVVPEGGGLRLLEVGVAGHQGLGVGLGRASRISWKSRTASIVRSTASPAYSVRTAAP